MRTTGSHPADLFGKLLEQLGLVWFVLELFGNMGFAFASVERRPSAGGYWPWAEKNLLGDPESKARDFRNDVSNDRLHVTEIPTWQQKLLF